MVIALWVRWNKQHLKYYGHMIEYMYLVRIEGWSLSTGIIKIHHALSSVWIMISFGTKNKFSKCFWKVIWKISISISLEWCKNPSNTLIYNLFKNISKVRLEIKACVLYFSSNFYFYPNDSPSKTMKNAFYFI